ncbi:hypothetical protein AMTRI_Chr13g91870 [Amborella trichopoda]
MEELLRKMLPNGAPIPDEDHLDYSFAMEYEGPPLSYELPRIIPVEIDRIPEASPLATSLFNKLLVPIVQPLSSRVLQLQNCKSEIGVNGGVRDLDEVEPRVQTDCKNSEKFDLEELNRESRDSGYESYEQSMGVIGEPLERECLVLDENGEDMNWVSSDSDSSAYRVSGDVSEPCLEKESLKVNENREVLNWVSTDSSCASPLLSSDAVKPFLKSMNGIEPILERESRKPNENGKDLNSVSTDCGRTFPFSPSDASHACAKSLDGIEPTPDRESLKLNGNEDDLNWALTDSSCTSPFLSSDASSWKGEGHELPCEAKMAQGVTFLVEGESQSAHHDIVEISSVTHDNVLSTSTSEENSVLSQSQTRRGVCYRCLKGNRFTEKEACIVCNAKYCGNCILRAMGSMPEGRKCLTCIGKSIDESRRQGLGKSSRILKRLLDSLEIQLIMRSEKTCETNQIQPEHVFVNGKQLSSEEMASLMSCAKPPAKVKPGSYWYDKVSGLWGKEGHKPDQIISPNMNVGGTLMTNASNGNTQVLINGREITKKELRMLKLAGVQCVGKVGFWLNADGSYLEEGQKNIKGNIWGKPGMRLVCSLLSLPVPNKSSNVSGENVSHQFNSSMPEYLEQKTLQKVLLVGYHGSGTSTLFKQAKFLYKDVPFSEDERQIIKLMIQTNVYYYLGILLEGCERFEEENVLEMKNHRLLDESSGNGDVKDDDIQSSHAISPRLKSFSDWLLNVMVAGNLEAIFPASTREYARKVEELWKDAAIQAAYSRRNELQSLPGIASYFLERVVEISRAEYEPSDKDILYTEGITPSNGVASMEFSFPHSEFDDNVDATDPHDPLLRYQLIRVHARLLRDNRKWLDMFEDVHSVVLCIASTDYDQLCTNDQNGCTTNKMLLNRKLFETLVTHPSFSHTPFFLVLTKLDLLEEKIHNAPLSSCEWFNGFNPVLTRNRSSSLTPNSSTICKNNPTKSRGGIMYYNSPSKLSGGTISNGNSSTGSTLGQQAYHYMAVKFKRLFASLTGRKLYVSGVNGWERSSVDGALRYLREVMKWNEEREAFCSGEDFGFSTEVSSFQTDTIDEGCKTDLALCEHLVCT